MGRPLPRFRETTEDAIRKFIQLLGRPLECRDPERTVEAIVVLGCPPNADGTLSAVGRERVEYGVSLYQKTLAPWLLMTGGGAGPVPEADRMADYAVTLGVPREHVLVERQSRSTAENARFSAVVLRNYRIATVCVITQPFHARRARHLFRRAGVDASTSIPPDSLQYQNPRFALRWIAREYAALAKDLFRRA